MGRKLILFIALAMLVLFFALGGKQYLSLSFVQENLSTLTDLLQANFLTYAALYCIIYILVCAFSIPGAAILTLLGGALFGFVNALVMVSFSSVIGASLAFLGARYVFRDTLKKKYTKTFNTIDAGMKREGVFYLLMVRLTPIFPFFLINIAMGLTNIRLVTYAAVSWVGMLPGTAVYVQAGEELGQLESLAGILSPSFILTFSLLGAFPLIAKKTIDYIKSRRVYQKWKRPSQYDYNVVVIGAGSAGLVSAYIAAAVKAKVVLIEKEKMGGDCLNTGCVPSKALIKAAKIADGMRQAGKFGIEAVEPRIDFQKAMGRVHDVIKSIEPHDSVERYSKLGVECLSGTAKIVSPWEVQVDGDRILTTRNIIVATGARPFIPDIPGLKDSEPLTSDTIWSLKEQPQTLIVMGGGPIGCELAQAFQRLGTQVVLVQRGSRLLPKEEPFASEAVLQSFQADGLDVKLEHTVTNVSKRGTTYEVRCRDSKQQEVIVTGDALIVCVGRKARVEGFGLEELGIKEAKNGTLEHDVYMRTLYPNIFVCGDVAGPYQFTHTAAHQAWFAAVNALFGGLKKFKQDYRVIPWVTFTDPEVAHVGKTEAELKDEGSAYEEVSFPFDDLDRTMADGDVKGRVSVLVKKGGDTILGATVVGTHGAALLQEITLAMKAKVGLNTILGTIHPYPTPNEGVKYVAGEWKRKNAPQKLLRWVEKFHRWSRK